MITTDYFATSLAELAGELDRLSAGRAPVFEMNGALSRYETTLMRLAQGRRRHWVAGQIHRLAVRHHLTRRARPMRLNDQR